MNRLFNILYRALLPHGLLVQRVLVVSSGHVVSAAILLAVSPILTHLFQPSDLGLLGVYTSLLAVLGVLSTCRYEAAISLPADDQKAANIAALCVVISVIVSAMLGIGFWILAAFLPTPGDVNRYKPFVVLFLLNLIAYGSYQACVFWLIRRREFGRIARLRVTCSLSMALIQVSLGWLAFGAVGLVAGCLVGYGASVILLMPGIHDRNSGSVISATALRKVAIRYRRFPIYSVGSTVLTRLPLLAPPLLLAAFYGLQVAGWYALAQRVVANPLSVMGIPASRVFLGEAAKIWREGSGKLNILFLRTVKRMCYWGVPPTLVCMFVAPWGFGHLFGAVWIESGVYCRILAPMIFLQILANVVATAFDVLEKQRVQLLATFLITFMTASAVLISHAFALPARSVLTVLSISSGGGSLFIIWLAWLHIRKTGSTRAGSKPDRMRPLEAA